MAKTTGNRFNALSGSVSDCASGDGAGPVATGNEKREAGHVPGPRPSVSPFPFPVSRASYESIDERAKEDHNAHDPIRREKRRVEATQVSAPDQPVLPGDQRGAHRDAGVVRGSQGGPDAEGDETGEGESVQHLRDEDRAALPQSDRERLKPLSAIERLVGQRDRKSVV